MIAFHEAAAGRTDAAADAHLRAAEEARSVSAHEVARDHLEAALALGHGEVMAVRRDLGEVLTLLGDYPAALAHLEAAAALAAPDAVADIEHRIGIVHARRGDWARADAHLAAALADVDEPRARARILADRSATAERRGDPDAADRWAREALAIAQQDGDPVGAARARGLLGMLARRGGDLASGRGELEAALDLLGLVDDVNMEADRVRVGVLNSLALVLGALGDPDAGIERAGHALAGCIRIGDRHRQAAIENNLADLCHQAGRSDQALEHLGRAVALFAEVDADPAAMEPEIWKLVEW